MRCLLKKLYFLIQIACINVTICFYPYGFYCAKACKMLPIGIPEQVFVLKRLNPVLTDSVGLAVR